MSSIHSRRCVSSRFKQTNTRHKAALILPRNSTSVFFYLLLLVMMHSSA
jgi:hypothetical protein